MRRIRRNNSPCRAYNCMAGGKMMLKNTDFIIVKPPQKGGFYVREKNNGSPLCYAKDSVWSAKRLAKKFAGKKIICDKACFRREKTKAFIREYDSLSDDCLMKAFKLAFLPSVEKFGLNLPLSEIYIAASPKEAVKIIEEIKFSSRLFTVISSEENTALSYDELYFKYGIVIRQLPFFSNKTREGELLIKGKEALVPDWIYCPVISFSKEDISANKAVAVRKILIKNESDFPDKNILSPVFYELMGKNLDENCEVDVNNNAEKIFLLDIT